MILAVALSVNFIGDGLRDAFDPRQSGKFKKRRLLGIFGRKEALDAYAKDTAAKKKTVDTEPAKASSAGGSDVR